MIASMDGGGSERQTLMLLRHLSREKFKPELFVLRRGGSLYEQIPSDVPVHCLEDSLPKSKCSWRDRIPGQIHRAQVVALRQILIDRQIDVIYDRTFHMTLIAGPAASPLGVPRVSTIVSPPSHAVPLNGGRFLAIKKWRLARAYANAAQVIAVSEPAAADARAYYRLKTEQICAVPNPVDADELDAVVAANPAPPRDERTTIVCVGRMSREKGQACLIQAVAQLRELYPKFPLPRVWLVGDGPLRSDLETLTHKLDLQNSIDFVGHVTQPAPWIAAADGLCLPSTFEGFPNVMLEAMALGTPVIASDIDVVRSLGNSVASSIDRGFDYVAIYRDHDPLNLAHEIQRLFTDTAATGSRRGAARSLARESHSIANIVPKIEAILLEAIASTSG